MALIALFLLIVLVLLLMIDPILSMTITSTRAKTPLSKFSSGQFPLKRDAAVRPPDTLRRTKLHLSVYLIDALKPESMQMISGRERFDATETGISNDARARRGHQPNSAE